MAAQGVAAVIFLMLCLSAGAQQTNIAGSNSEKSTADLANRAVTENLPQVSAAVLRTQIQQEQDAKKRMDLTRRLVELLVTGRRFDEALAVGSTADIRRDPTLAYWKAEALLGAGDTAAAKEIFSSLMNRKTEVLGINPDQISLGLARSLRGGKQTEDALKLLAEIPMESPLAEDVMLEKGVALLSLGRAEECRNLLHDFTPSTDEGKAMALYLRALTAWQEGNSVEARKLFLSVPPVTPWCSAASTIGASLTLASTADGKNAKMQQAIDLLEKHIDQVDDDPLLDVQFQLLDQLYTNASTPDTTMMKKWAEDLSRPARSRIAAFYQGKGELRLSHYEKGDALMDAFIRKYGDDILADQARCVMALSRLQRGEPINAIGLVADKPNSPLRAKMAYLRGIADAGLNRKEEAKADFELAGSLDPKLIRNALFNKAVLVASTDKGVLDSSEAARNIVEMNAGLPSEEMEFQIALDLARRSDPRGGILMGKVADRTSDASLKSRARLAAAEWNMKSGKGEVADVEMAKAVHENSADPEREKYLNVFLKDTGRRGDSQGVISAAQAFLKSHPDSRFTPEVRLKLAESLLASGDIQAARVEFEQLAYSGAGTEIGRRALFLAAQSAARAMDPSSLDDSLMLLERVAEHGTNDQLVWQARLQQGSLKNAQNLPLEALAIYDKILSGGTMTGVTNGANRPDTELLAAALMAKADTLHQLAIKDSSKERDAVKTWQQVAGDPSMPIRWRNQALCKSGLILEKLGESDGALTAYYEAFKNPRSAEPEQLWHDKAAFEAGRLLESRRQWNDAVTLYGQVVAEGGPRAEEAKARLSKLRLENFLWEN